LTQILTKIACASNQIFKDLPSGPAIPTPKRAQKTEPTPGLESRFGASGTYNRKTT
jgi:hypothetical protein